MVNRLPDNQSHQELKNKIWIGPKLAILLKCPEMSAWAAMGQLYGISIFITPLNSCPSNEIEHLEGFLQTVPVPEARFVMYAMYKEIRCGF